MKFLRFLKITIVFICITFQLTSQNNYQAPTLSAGLDNVTFKKGTLDVELLAKIISEKQQELVREGIKRTIYKSIGNSEKLDDFTQFYIERVVDVIFNEKNHRVITKRVLEETTNYLFILGITKYVLQSKNEAVKFLFLKDDSFTNLDKNIKAFSNFDTIQIKNIKNYSDIKKELENIDSYTVKNAIITSILTICKEIPIVKKLGLLNDFNYLEHKEIYNETFNSNKSDLIKLISLEKYFDFNKIDSISIKSFNGTLKDLLKTPNDSSIPNYSYLLEKLDIKKCISILKIYRTIKELISNSNILKDITSKSGIKFSSIEKDLSEVIKNYEKLNVFSFNDDQLIFSSKNGVKNKVNIKNLISHYNTIQNEINRFKEQSSNIDNALTTIKSIQTSDIYLGKNIAYNILEDAVKNGSKESIRAVINQIPNRDHKNFINSKTSDFINKSALDSLTNLYKIDLVSLNNNIKKLKENKNYLYVGKLMEELDTINLYSSYLAKVKDHQTFLGEYLKLKNSIINENFNQTLLKINNNYNEIRKLFKLSQALLYSYNYLVDNTNDDLEDYINNILLKKEKNKFIVDKLKNAQLYSTSYTPTKNKITRFINLIQQDLNNIQIKSIDFSINLPIKSNDFYASLESALIEVGSKINLGDYYKKNTYNLYLEIKKTLNIFNFELKENSILTENDSELLKKLYETFSDRNLEEKVQNLNILQNLNDEYLSELRVLASKIRAEGKISLAKIINSINFSNTKLLVDKTKENQKYLSTNTIDNILNFLKFIGNIKEFNKAETFTFLLKTMDDYKHLLNFDDENLRIIPDLINSLRTYSIIDYDRNLIEIDVASVLIHLLEKYQEKSDVIFYATVGVNQFFIPNFDKQNPSNTNYSFGSFNAASEKIGAKWKVIDWNKKYYRENELIHKIRRKAYVSDYYVMAYVSGILYKIANTSGNDFDSAQIGLATGFTFFNSLDFNISLSVPFDSEPFKNYIFGFSFDIPLSEYLKRL